MADELVPDGRPGPPSRGNAGAANLDLPESVWTNLERALASFQTAGLQLFSTLQAALILRRELELHFEPADLMVAKRRSASRCSFHFLLGF